MKKTFLIILVSLLLLLLNTSHGQNYPMYLPYGYTINKTVARVIDGDTFVLSDLPAGQAGSLHVRMLGVNTPEIARFNKPAQPFADSATNFTRSLIEGKTVKLTFACPSEAKRRRDGKTYDIFGRLLCYVWLTNTAGKDSLFIQAELLKAGLARISHYPRGMRYYDLFYNLRRTAMRDKRGIWNK